MACTVCTKFFDVRINKEVSDLTGAEMLINGVSVIGAEGGISTQENAVLVFSYDNKLPGGGGYSFSNWEVSTDGGTSYTPISEQNLSVDATSPDIGYVDVRCCVNPNKYTITYSDSERGTIVTPWTQEMYFGDDTQTLLIGPSCSGYVFKGWEINGSLYAGESIFSIPVGGCNAEAKWVAYGDPSMYPEAEYVYEDEESGTEETVRLLQGIATVFKALASCQGKDNVGWSMSGGGTHRAGSSYTPTTSDKKTLTAQRSNKAFWVRFDLNGGNIGGQRTLDPRKVYYDETSKGASVVIPGAVSKSGSTFISWKGPGGAYYQPGATATITNSCTFTATFSPAKKITVTLDANGGKFDDSTTTRKLENVDINKKYPSFGSAPTRDGYIYRGFFTTSSASGGAEVTENDIVSNPSNHKLWARWDVVKTAVYTVPNTNAYVVDPIWEYGKESCSKTLTIGDSYALLSPANWDYTSTSGKASITKTSRGWFDSKLNVDGTCYGNSNQGYPDIIVTKQSSHKKELWARWDCSIVFKTGPLGKFTDGTTEKIIEYEYAKPYKELPSDVVPYSAERKFVGWYDTEDTGETTYEGRRYDIGEVPPSNVQYVNMYARFTAKVQTVTFNLNNDYLPAASKASWKDVSYATMKYGIGDEGQEKPPTYNPLPSEKYIDCRFYKLNGWYTAPTGGTEITILTEVTEAEERTFYAHWDRMQAVSIDYMGGTNAGATHYVKGYQFGGKYYNFNDKDVVPTKSGYTFSGFFTTEGEGGEQITKDTTVTGDSNLRLYTHWEQKPQKRMGFNAGSGSIYVSEKLVPENSAIGTLPIPTPPKSTVLSSSSSRDSETKEKTFGGWKVNGNYIDSDFIMNDDYEAEAVWLDKIVLYYVKDTTQQNP